MSTLTVDTETKCECGSNSVFCTYGFVCEVDSKFSVEP